MRLEKLASKSKQQYENAYDRFMDWREENNITTFTEEDMISYFTMLADKLKYSSIFKVYSMLKTTLQAKHNVDIGCYKNMITFIKEQSKYALPRKDSLLGFTAKQILEFVNNAPDKTYLLPKVVLIIGVTASLGRDELKALTIDDVEETNNSIIVKIRKEKHTICGPFYTVCKKYLALRPSMGYGHDRSFFLNYQPGKNTRKYQAIGKNKLSGYAQEVAKYLKLPNIKAYNAKSFRKTAKSLGLDSKGNLVKKEWVKILKNRESGNEDSEEDTTPFEFPTITIKVEKADGDD